MIIVAQVKVKSNSSLSLRNLSVQENVKMKYIHTTDGRQVTLHNAYNTDRREFAPGFVNCEKGCTRLAAESDQAYQLLAHGWWFSPGSPASSTTKTGRHDIVEILLKVALSTINQIKYSTYSNQVDIYIKLINDR
jgi:hypothetical protein